MRSERTFEPSAGSVKETRRFVASLLEDDEHETVECVTLMVSELASNCVRHAGTPFSVTVDRSETGLRIEVVDRGSGMPELRIPSPLDPSGRGLAIVDSLSADWGITPSDGPGKTVWFLVPIPPERERSAEAHPSR